MKTFAEFLESKTQKSTSFEDGGFTHYFKGGSLTQRTDMVNTHLKKSGYKHVGNDRWVAEGKPDANVLHRRETNVSTIDYGNE